MFSFVDDNDDDEYRKSIPSPKAKKLKLKS